MRTIVPALIACALFGAATALPPTSAYAQSATQPQIYGSQLMTPQERAEHRTKMRNAATADERDWLRAEHHARMQERAKEMGVTLPDQPPATGMGRGMGPGGAGQGMGRRKGG